jgi:ketosteroid isomerase-like protein
MKANRSSVAAVALACACACGGGQSKDDVALPPPTPEQVVSAARGVLEQYEQGYEVLSVAALQPLYVGGLDVVVVVQGKPHRGWTQIETYLKDLFAATESVRLAFTDVSAVALGDDAAEVTATVARERKEGALVVKENGVLSLTLSRIDDRWLIRTEHFSYGR